MTHIKGWTLVLAWITTGFALWFFHSIWPGLNSWLKDNQHLSGWMQFIGAVLAIMGAYHLGTMQTSSARKLARERQVIEALRTFETVRVILEHAHHVLRAYEQSWTNSNVPPHRDDHGEWVRVRDSIAAIDTFKLPSPNLVGSLLQLPKCLDAAIEARADANVNYFENWPGGSPLPKPPLKPLLDTMYNKIDQAVGMLRIAIEACYEAQVDVHKKLPP